MSPALEVGDIFIVQGVPPTSIQAGDIMVFDSSQGTRTIARALSRKRRGKREYLNNVKTGDFMKELYKYFQMKVEIPRIRVGKRQELEILINEEALVFAKFLRDERESWIPRIAVPETSE